MALSLDLPLLRVALLAAVPLCYSMAALGPMALHRSPQIGWRLARWATGLAGISAALSMAWLVAAGPRLVRADVSIQTGIQAGAQSSLRSDAPGVTMLLLVSFIGWVIVGFSQSYLQGERGQPRYLRALMVTLAAVSVLVITNHLLLLALAWIVTSLALHALLTFYDQRPQALIAAHKKFLASRVADLCLLVAIALLWNSLGTLEIDQAIVAARALEPMPAALQTAALLVAASALLKCAQLPVHGWLIQVMEAPTPVSALLHAGVVNLGGFLLIRMGTLVGDVPAAQALLVVVGSVTAVVAALVTTTRISVKVALAWSTCAQMGFMMMQCGLGLYELALLHLVAHSSYKAYAFLSAGSAVEQDRLRQMTPPAPRLSFATGILGALVGAALVCGAALVWGVRPLQEPGLWAMAGVLSLALAPLVGGTLRWSDGSVNERLRWAGVLAALSVALAYFGLHAVFGRWLGIQTAHPPAALTAWVLVWFCILFAVQWIVRAAPEGRLAHRLYPWFYAGFYLDELFTRLTFRVWPARLPPSTSPATAPTGTRSASLGAPS